MLFLVALAASALPTPALQTAIKESIGKKLADPYSAQYEWQPVKNEMSYCGWVNAKNQFGAYTGLKPFMVLYSVGLKSKQTKVLSVSLTPAVVTKMCLDDGYRLTP